MGDMRTPLGKVRGLGSAKEGSDHFWEIRLTGLASIPLTLFLVWLIARLAGEDFATVTAYLGSPLIGISLLAMVLAGVMHMRLGMQVVIEDYVSTEGLKILCLIANTFFSILIGLACVYSVIKLSFGA